MKIRYILKYFFIRLLGQFRHGPNVILRLYWLLLPRRKALFSEKSKYLRTFVQGSLYPDFHQSITGEVQDIKWALQWKPSFVYFIKDDNNAEGQRVLHVREI
jgi:hypothetical protein